MLAMISALSAELAVTRERLDTVERLLAEREIIDKQSIEHFEPPPEASAERDAMRRRLIERIFQPVRDAAVCARKEWSENNDAPDVADRKS